MYAVLGPIEFKVITFADAMDTTQGADYAEHALIGRKPRLQFVGLRLNETRLELEFHEAYCNPDQEYARLEAALNAHTSLAFVLANGVYKGDFVITELSATAKHTDKVGNTLALSAKLTLREFTGDPSKPAKPRPPAVVPAGSAVPVAVRNPVVKASKGNPAGQISKLAAAVAKVKSVMAVAQTVAASAKAIKQYRQNPAAALAALGSLVAVGNRLIGPLDQASRATSVVASLNQASTVVAGLTQVRSAVLEIKKAKNGANTANIASKLSQLGQAADQIGRAADTMQVPLAQLAAKAATRKG